MRTVAVTLSILLVFSACAPKREVATRETPREANPLYDLNGTWTGQLKRFEAPGLSARSVDYDLWITIEGDQADVWYRWEGKWERLWDGAPRFSVARHKSNAVLYASNSKPSVTCHWVETWSFTVSQFRPGTLETFFYRMVNNTGCPEQGQFAYGATGTLTRKSTSVVKP